MPTDRLITVTLTTEGMRNQVGVYVPGTVTTVRTWATRMDKSQEDIEQEGGIADSTRRDWRIRWDSRLADRPISQMAIVDGPTTFNVLNMIEVTGRRGELRRRWLEIEGVFTT